MSYFQKFFTLLVTVLFSIISISGAGINLETKSFELSAENRQAGVEETATVVGEAEDYPLRAPVLTEIKRVDDGVEISWERVQGAEMYRVLRKTSEEEWENIGDTDEPTFIDVMADQGVEYTYSVRCVSFEGERFLSSQNDGKTIIFE